MGISLFFIFFKAGFLFGGSFDALGKGLSTWPRSVFLMKLWVNIKGTLQNMFLLSNGKKVFTNCGPYAFSDP